MSEVASIGQFYWAMTRLYSLIISCDYTWLRETFAECAGTVEDIIPESEAITLILRLNPAVDTLYINQKLKVSNRVSRLGKGHMTRSGQGQGLRWWPVSRSCILVTGHSHTYNIRVVDWTICIPRWLLIVLFCCVTCSALIVVGCQRTVTISAAGNCYCSKQWLLTMVMLYYKLIYYTSWQLTGLLSPVPAL